MISFLYYKLRELLACSSIRSSNIDQSVWIGSNNQIYNSSIGYGSYLGNNCQCINT